MGNAPPPRANQSSPDQSSPDQSRPDQSSPDQRWHHALAAAAPIHNTVVLGSIRTRHLDVVGAALLRSSAHLGRTFVIPNPPISARRANRLIRRCRGALRVVPIAGGVAGLSEDDPATRHQIDTVSAIATFGPVDNALLRGLDWTLPHVAERTVVVFDRAPERFALAQLEDDLAPAHNVKIVDELRPPQPAGQVLVFERIVG